ncbi:MAG: zf-HC2 domain-containing protein, partial [Phycisphaerae bacterium]|nr:zf-HC2 domain-containing protein [Phycisphaerae bacterium]
MKCQEIENHLSAYMDDELPAELAAAVREHLADCPACRGVLAELDATAGLLRSLPQVPAPGGLAEAVGAEIRNRALARKAPVADKRPVWPRICAAAAAVFLVAGVGYLLINEKGIQDQPARLAAHHEETGGDALPLLAARAPVDSLARGSETESFPKSFLGEKRRSGQGGEGFLADRSSPPAGRAAVGTSLAKAAGEAEANGPLAEFASKADDLEDRLRRDSKVGEKIMIATAPATPRGPAKVLDEDAREAGREATKDAAEKVARAEVAPESEDEVLEKEASEPVGFDNEEDEAEAVAVLAP